MFCTKIN